MKVSDKENTDASPGNGLRHCLGAWVTLLLIVGGAISKVADAQNPEQVTPVPGSSDPFADLEGQRTAAAVGAGPSLPQDSFLDLFGENFSFRRELFSQLSFQPGEKADPSTNDWYSRQSVGFETLKKFSTETSTLASFDLQGRFVRRDRFIDVIDDTEGRDRRGWYFEIHNAYLDLYNVLNPAGHFNIRVGRFYLPFGLNLQTDTHGTVLQLSNDRNFGYERDWYAGLWGSINPDLNYDLYYLVGSGYDLAYRGQHGLVGSRISLSNKYSNEYGIEGGVAVMAGQRLAGHRLAGHRGQQDPMASPDGEPEDTVIDTSRVGVDGRYSYLLKNGSLITTAELSGGEDEAAAVFTQLYQLEYLHRSRKWGISSQYRRFYQEADGLSNPSRQGNSADGSIIGEMSWYFRNDIGNTTLHWIKLNVEQQLERIEGEKSMITTIQYYRYW